MVATFFVSLADRVGSTWINSALSGIYVISFMSFALLFGCLQGEQRFTSLNWLRIVNPTLSAIALFTLLVLAHHAPVSGVFGILVLGNVVACALGGYLVRARKAGRQEATGVTTRSLLRYGLAAMPAANAPLETLSLDQAAVGALLPRPQLGLYVVAAAFDNLASILITAYGSIALPRITGEPDPIARRRFVRRTAIGAAWIATAASVFAELIVGWLLPLAFGDSFAAAIPVARVLIVAGLLLSFRRILVVLLQAAGRPGRTAAGELIALGALAVTAVVLVPLFGMVGAACALIFAAVVANAYLIWMLRSAYK